MTIDQSTDEGTTTASVLPIVTLPARVLTQASAPVGPKLLDHEVMVVDDEIKTLIANMRATLDGQHGWGLAAPQVGVSKRVVLARLHGAAGPVTALINPRIISSSSTSAMMIEACFSVPRKSAKVRRATKVTATAYLENGDPVLLEVDGMAARVLQHEIDHLNGILFTARKS